MLATIQIDRLKIFAHHGVLPQERTVGANFYVSLEAEVEITREATEQDQLAGTVNYAQLTKTVLEEMKIPSMLLEHVAHRIARRILDFFPPVHRITVHVEKENPPLGVLCKNIGVKITLGR